MQEAENTDSVPHVPQSADSAVDSSCGVRQLFRTECCAWEKVKNSSPVKIGERMHKLLNPNGACTRKTADCATLNHPTNKWKCAICNLDPP
jgi:hypothetical protein